MEIEKNLAMRVKLTEAEKIRRYLFNNSLLRNDLIIKKDEKFIYFPLKKISDEINPNQIIRIEFEKRNKKPNSYKDLLNIPNNLKSKLPTSYDIIGNIAILKLTDELIFYSKIIGEALLESNKNIKTVCISNPVCGELRIRNLKIIAGANKTLTIHKEYSLMFKVDVGKTYFSPRLANERRRVANLVQSGETVFDMFAGVAPFSIMIAKYSNPKIVYAVDKNKDSVMFAKENIKINKVLDKVEIFHLDVKNISNRFYNSSDRIIMNLPFSSFNFFENAIRIAKNKCFIHYYDVLNESDIYKRVEDLKEIALKNNVTLTCINVKKIKTYAPREFYIVIDITATKNADVA